MSGPRHIVVVNRWQARYAEYERYADHGHDVVTYVSTEVGLGSVPATATEVAIVPATDDLEAVRAAVRRLAARYGPPALIVALKEDDLLVGADLRAEWGCPGPTRDEVVPFRDKLVMAQRVVAAGLAVPTFAPAPDRAAVLAFAEAHGWPVVVKPTRGSSSQDVTIAHCAEDVATLPPAAMVQSFQPGDIYYVDGVFTGERLSTWRVCRYLTTCLDFRYGAMLGAVQEGDPAMVERIGRFTRDALAALSDKPVVFHFELFVHEDRCVFLEVGARVGGGEIPFLWREVHGYDLMEAGFRIAIGQHPQPPPERESTEFTGELLAPAPARRPCRIVESTSVLGTVPGLYAEAILRPGEVLPDADAYYEHVGGRFRFRGPTSASVEEAIAATAAAFRVSAEPLMEAA